MKTFFTREEPVVPGHHPRVLVDVAVAQGAARDAVLEGVLVAYDALALPETRLSYAEYARIAENAMRLTGNPAIGLDFGKNAHVAHWGVLGLAAKNSATARAALEMSLQYYRMFAPGWDLAVTTEGEQAVFVARETIPRGAVRVFATEALLSSMRTLSIEVMKRPLPVHELRLNYPKPAHAVRYDELFDGPIFFDRAVTEVVFDARILDEPIAGADPAMAVVAQRYCAAEASLAPGTAGLLAEVRKVLAEGDTARPRLRDVAKKLRTSERSLRRALQEMGVPFHKVLEETLRARAEERLRAGGPKLEQIATELGFSDTRSFRRAFRRWTGVSPSDYARGSRG